MLGIGIGAAKWRGSAVDHSHQEARVKAILAQARQMPSGGVVVIGDSITEQMRLETLCGLPALNAGITWATSADWLPHAQAVIEAAKPSIVILALGTNDQAIGPEYRQLAKLADFAVQPANKSVSAVIRAAPAPTSTSDGIHPDLEGAEQWKRNVEALCPKAPDR